MLEIIKKLLSKGWVYKRSTIHVDSVCCTYKTLEFVRDERETVEIEFRDYGLGNIYSSIEINGQMTKNCLYSKDGVVNNELRKHVEINL